MSIKSKFCARCGKVTESLRNGLCPACYLEENQIKGPTSLVLKVCPKCGAVLWKGVWLRADKLPEFYFKELIKSKLRLPKNVELSRIDIVETGNLGRVSILLKIIGNLVEKQLKMKIEINKFACPDCSRQKADWMVKLQVRGVAVDTVLAMASKHRARIVKTQQQKTGVDIYFFTRSAANKLANQLKKQFGLTLKKSYEQHGHDFDTGKPLHREIISLR